MAFLPSHMERIRIICSVLIRTTTTHWFLVRNSPRIIEKVFQWFADNIVKKCVCVFVRQKSQFLYSQFLLFILIWNISSLIKMIFLVIVNWCLRKLNFMGEWYVNVTANVLLLPQPTSYTMGRQEVCTQELTKGECTLYIQHNSTTFRTHRLSWCIVMMEGWSRT